MANSALLSILLASIFTLSSISLNAQIDSSNCEPELILNEAFGAGSINPGPELATGTTTYCFENLQGSCPSNSSLTPGSIDDGSYSIMNDPLTGLTMSNGETTGWITLQDHTPDDEDGYMLVVNAHFEPGEFYRLNNIEVVTGSQYTFSAWFANILSIQSIVSCGAGQVPVNVNFVVEDANSGNILGASATGDIFGTGQELWVEKIFNFIAISPKINIVLVNNAPGGCGNDFAIDDIVLIGCVGNTTTAVNDTFTIDQGGSLVDNLLNNDLDVEGHDQTIVLIEYDSDGDGLPDTDTLPGVTINTSGQDTSQLPVANAGTLEIGPNGAITFIPPADFSGEVHVTYIVCDNGVPVLCDTAEVLITVIPEVVLIDTTVCIPELIFEENFGSGAVNPGPALPAGTITYCYQDLVGSCPSTPALTPGSINDGAYSIMNDPLSGIIYANGDTAAWISSSDHTIGDIDGYMLVVNADFAPGEFYRLNDIPIVEGEEYAFSAWFLNILSQFSIDLCADLQVPVNVSFNMEDAATGALLGSVSTGDIFATSEPQWIQTEFLFTASSTNVNIVLVNSGPGGCGNDFAIDDIQLIGCVSNTTNAVDDTFTIAQDETLNGNVLQNDFDIEGHDQSVVLFEYDSGNGSPDESADAGQTVIAAGVDTAGQPVDFAGSLTIDAEGGIEFIPEPDFIGEVYVTYVVCDNGIPVVCDTANVVIIVQPADIPPPEEEICDIPDVITPNGDGLNDYFELECAPVLPRLQLIIYNRWGNQVFDSGAGYANDWQGTYGRKGKPLPEGTYFYIVSFNDADHTTQAGDLLILR